MDEEDNEIDESKEEARTIKEELEKMQEEEEVSPLEIKEEEVKGNNTGVMEIQNIDDEATVKVGNKVDKEVFLYRYAVKVAFERGDSNLSWYIRKLRLIL